MYPIEPPRRLKDFLIDDDPIFTTCRNSQISGDNHKPPPAALPRSRSRSRTAVESFQKLLRRSLHVITPAPGTLPRSFSRRLLMIGFRWPDKNSKLKSKKGNKVKVKDILRWRSFHDLAEDSQPLDLAGKRVGPASETLPFGWDYCNLLEDKKVSLDGGDLLEGTMDALDSTQVGPKDNKEGDDEDDKEQHSPVSILDSPFRDETLLLESEPETSSFNQSLANMERTKQRLLQSIQWFENLAGLDDESCLEEEDEEEINELVINEERIRSRVHVNMGLCWVQKGMNGLRDSEECSKDMEKYMQWGIMFGEEKEELSVEVEVNLFNELVDDLLVDLFACE